MAHSGMTGCRTCCVECTIDSDDFNRADDTALGAKWTEVLDNWSIVGNKLQPPLSSLGSVLKFNTADPGTADGIRWTATFSVGSTLAGILRWIVDYVDADNYHFAEIQISGSSTLRLWKRESGTETALTDALDLDGVTTNSSHTLSVCWGLQSIVPACSTGSVGWIWTLGYNEDGSDGWQPISITGDCWDGACAIFTQPAVTGTEIEGDTTTTGCTPVLGGEGESIFGISASFNDTQGLGSEAVSMGGTHVGFGATNVVEDVYLDDASLTLLRSGCPDCPSLSNCAFCLDGIAPKYLQVTIASGAFAGTYLLPFTVDYSGAAIGGNSGWYATNCETDTKGAICVWAQDYTLDPAVCGSNAITVYAATHVVGTTAYLVVGVLNLEATAFTVSGAIWETAIGTTTDPGCDALDNLELPFKCRYLDEGDCFNDVDPCTVQVP